MLINRVVLDTFHRLDIRQIRTAVDEQLRVELEKLKVSIEGKKSKKKGKRS